MPRKALVVCCSVAAGALLLAAYLWIAGSAVVLDRNGQVVSAVVTDTPGRVQRLHRLPGGTFYAIPRWEGEIEIRCRDGSRQRGGYVTPHLHEWIQVRPGPVCGRVMYVP